MDWLPIQGDREVVALLVHALENGISSSWMGHMAQV